MGKNLIYISNSTIPSVNPDGVHVMKMSNSFANMGYNTTLITVNNRKLLLPTEENIYDYYDVKDNFAIRKIPYYGIKGKSILQCGNFLLELFKQRDPLVYSRHLFGAYCASLFGYETIYEIHVDPSEEPEIVKRITRKIFASKNCRLVVTISEALKKRIQDFYNQDLDIFVAPDGLTLPLRPNSEQFHLKGDFRIGYAGSLKKGRGIELIIELSKRFPDISFHIAGGTQEELSVRRQETETENVFFHGNLPHSEVFPFLSECNILLMPYQHELSIGHAAKVNTSGYMSPMKLFEYMGTEVPFISSDLPVIKEIVKDKIHCLLVEPERTQDWENAIKQLRNKRDFAKEIAKNAKEEVLAKYTWKHRSQNILEEYSKITNN